jgi:hypothetical protein
VNLILTVNFGYQHHLFSPRHISRRSRKFFPGFSTELQTQRGRKRAIAREDHQRYLEKRRGFGGTWGSL